MLEDIMNQVVERQRIFLKKLGLDALIACSPTNVSYTIGMRIATQSFILSRQCFTIVTPTDSRLVVVNMEEAATRRYANIEKIYAYKEFLENPIDALAKNMEEMGLSNANVGFEIGYLPASDYAHLVKVLPKVTFEKADEIFRDIRMVKTPEEIERLRKVGGIADKIHATVYEKVHAGNTEKELGALISGEFIRLGGDAMSILTVASGERSGLANGSPTEKKLEKGELVRCDIVGNCNAYFSDCARTVVVGKPSEKQNDIWKKILECHHELLNLVHAGVETRVIYEKFTELFTKYGFPIDSFVGHGVGVDLHEWPLIGKYEPNVLEENMVICIEPFIFSEGAGYHVEDMLIIKKNGFEKITGNLCGENLLYIPE